MAQPRGLWLTAELVRPQVARPQVARPRVHSPRVARPDGQEAEAQPRPDLAPALAGPICAGELGKAPAATWLQHTYDAQIEGHHVAAHHGLPVGLEALRSRAHSLATLRSMGGYSYGLCPDGQSGWLAIVPAPTPLLTAAGSAKGEHHKVAPQAPLAMPVADLQRRCAAYQADFAPARPQAGHPVLPLSLKTGTVDTASLGDGVVSLSCQPRTPRWRGPVLWYLYPVGNGPEAVVPDAELLSPGEPAAVALLPWLQRMRHAQGLAPLIVSPQLSEAAANLAADGGLTHDRLMLKAEARNASAAHVQLLGEDRVRGRSAAQMAWLLWNSPRHRSLLLGAEATSLGLAGRPSGDEELVVLVTGKAELLNTAKGLQAEPGKQL